MNPPLWALRAICGGGGRAQIPADWQRQVAEPAPIRPAIVVPPPSRGFAVGNLPASDYRYWVGCEDATKKDCWCRFCGFHGQSELERRRHAEAQDCPTCNTNLVAAYKLLLADKNCVVCDQRANRAVYGIPICSMKCLNAWRFGGEFPSLEAAITLGIRRRLIVDRSGKARKVVGLDPVH